MMKSVVKLMATAILLFSACVFAADWPQYLGPNRDSTSTERGILNTWPAEGPELLWTIPLGVGFGGPAVVDGRVYLLDRDEEVGDTLRCLNLSDGEELWSFAYDAPGSFMFPGSRSTPAIDGDLIFTVGPMGDLYCIDINTHKPAWNKNIWKDFGGAEQLPKWGITQNPLVYNNLLIVAPQTPQAGVVAYDKRTGELKWKSAALSGEVGYVSPSFVKIGGEDHLVMITASKGRGRTASGGSVNGLDPLSGKALWTYENWQCSIPVPHAVDAGESRVLITGGYNAGAAMIQVGKKGAGYEVTELFKNIEFGAHTQPPILYKGNFYAQYTTNERNDGLVCMSMDGEIQWKTGKDPAFVRGGSVLVDNLLLSVDGNTMLYLIEPDPSGFKPLASIKLLTPGESWAPVALVDGKLILRDQKSLKCLAVGK